MAELDYHRDWLELDGRRFRNETGLLQVIKVRTYNAVYPYPHTAITVSAEYVDKTSKEYRETRAKMGDDFSTDVLNSSPEYQAFVLQAIDEFRELL